MEKLIGSFVQFPGIIVTSFAALYILKRKKAYLFLSLISYISLSEFLFLPIQSSWTVRSEPVKADTVVLGGGILKTQDKYTPSRATLYRLKKAFEIWKKFGGRIYVSGGEQNEKVSEASVMKKTLIEWGVPKNDIITEDRSKSTKENALFLADKLPRRFNLVTSAVHMRRSLMVFRKLGKDPIPVPTDFLIDNLTIQSFFPSESALDFLTEFSHEIIGIVYYKLGGM